MEPSGIICLLCVVNVLNVCLGQRSPTISYISQEQIKDIGGSVDFTCSVQYAADYPVIWSKIDKARQSEPLALSDGTTMIIPDSRFSVKYHPAESTYVLHVDGIQEADAGYYECQILISVELKILATVELQIRRPPIIFDNSTRSLVVIEGQSAKLECYGGGYPAPTISWRRENNWILSTGEAVHRGNVLQIQSITKEDRGTYYCVAENGVGRGIRRNIAVEVQFAPIVTATRRRVGQALTYDMNLECRIEAYPQPAITWLKDGDLLLNNQHYEISHSTSSDELTSTVIRVITIEKRQYGTYKCKAANIFGTSSAEIELFETVIKMCPPACGPN